MPQLGGDAQRAERFLELLAGSPEQGADRRRIAQQLWRSQQTDTDRRLEVMVARLRKKLSEHCGSDELLKTRWRGGHRLAAPMVVQSWCREREVR